MACDTYLPKSIEKSTFSVNFCKRLNTFDNFWGTFANGSIHSTISEELCKRLNTFDKFWGTLKTVKYIRLFPRSFCKRRNTFDNFHPKWLPPGVVRPSGTLRSPNVVPHLGWSGHLAKFFPKTKQNKTRPDLTTES